MITHVGMSLENKPLQEQKDNSCKDWLTMRLKGFVFCRLQACSLNAHVVHICWCEGA